MTYDRTYKKMKKKSIVALVIFICIMIISICIRLCFFNISNVIIRFTDIKLDEEERIVSADFRFQSASIESIRNIPPGWGFSLNLDIPPNPTVTGSITVGVAALRSAKELPFFEVSPYFNEVSYILARANLQIEKYSKGL